MSDWLLYHVWGIRNYRVTGHEKVTTQTTVISLEPLPAAVCCPQCKSKQVIRKGAVTRLLLATPIGSRETYFEVLIPRVHCAACGITRQIHLSFAEEHRRHTRQFERYALELARITTTLFAARHLGISWDTMRDIESRSLGRRYKHPKLKKLKRLAIDEIHLGKRLKYLTLVLDLDTGAIVFVGQGKGAESLRPFWRRLRGSGAKIAAVAADMSAAYALAVRENLPQAVLVNDRFHVIKLYNGLLTELRRELYREATDTLQRDVLKGTRWLLLKHMESLDEERQEPQRLLEALKLNESLAIAYYLRDDLNQFWEQPNRAAAERFLDSWLRTAWGTGIRLVIKFANTLAGHRNSLLAWYDYPISTGPLEAVNNKVRLLHRQAFGYRNPEFFALKLLALHETRYALVG